MNKFLPTLKEREEFANAITHGLGILLTIIGTPVLIGLGLIRGDRIQVLGLCIFCLSLLLVYTSSTLYHSIRNLWFKKILRKIDHISIYFLIAGTHTPFILKYLNNALGMRYLIILWVLVLVGIAYKTLYLGRLEWLSLVFYLGLGWMAIFTVPPMLKEMPVSSFYWILVGGFFYTSGVIFFLWEKLPYHHSYWHLFVLTGSAGHFMALFEAYK